MSLSDWLWRTPLDRVPFSELATRFPKEPNDVYQEFCRRLESVVHRAAEDYVWRQVRPAGTTAERLRILRTRADALTMDAFEAFVPRFTAGNPDYVLARFAQVLIEVLDEQAFQTVAANYYRLLPLYHVRSEAAFELLRDFFPLLLKDDGRAIDALAEPRGVSSEEVVSLLQDAFGELDRAIKDNFDRYEWPKLTGGVLPWPD